MQDMTTFIQNVPQMVPESWCLECKICCRFPDAQEVQTPTWSPVEEQWAHEKAVDPTWFQKSRGSTSFRPQLRSCAGGFRCPAFQAESNRCTIYSVRPLDCRLYPFVLTCDANTGGVTLAMDMKCPYLRVHENDPEVAAYAQRLLHYLENPLGNAYYEQNPEIAGSSWPEFVAISELPSWKSHATHKVSSLPHPALLPLTPAEIPVLEQAFGLKNHWASDYTIAALLGWEDLIHLWWMRRGGALCLFAEQAGGFFMPLPPMSREVSPALLKECWEILGTLNNGSGVSRIEGIEEEQSASFEEAGFKLTSGETEYLYRSDELVSLRGNRYHSQRSSIHRGRRRLSYRIRPFTERDLIPCLQLYTDWGIEQQKRRADPFQKALIRDGLFFHRRLMMDHEKLKLLGRVCEVSGVLKGYTFGAAVSPEMFCTFLEIRDVGLADLGSLLFWELCKELAGRFPYVNTMGDLGVSGLAQNKISYRPVRIAQKLVAVRA